MAAIRNEIFILPSTSYLIEKYGTDVLKQEVNKVQVDKIHPVLLQWVKGLKKEIEAIIK